jgi:hypothetical protein
MKLCAHPGCTNKGMTAIGDGKWLCWQHVNERINSPMNAALTESSLVADWELEQFRAEGRKPS